MISFAWSSVKEATIIFALLCSLRYFWERYNEAVNIKDPNARFHVIRTNSEEVAMNRKINEDWTEDQKRESLAFLEREKEEKSTLQYAQEYLGLFTDDLRRFFTDEWIKNTCTIKRENTLNITGKNYLGCDLARMGDDLSSFEVICDDNSGIFKQIESITTEKTLTTQTQNNIIRITKRFNAKKVGIDAGAGTLGVGILDNLMETEIRHKLIAINNRQVSLDDEGNKTQRIVKEDLYNNLLNLGETKKIQLLNDDDLIKSLESVQYEFITSTNRITRVRIFGRDTHIVEGLIRAAWLAKKEKSLNLWAM